MSFPAQTGGFRRGKITSSDPVVSPSITCEEGQRKGLPDLKRGVLFDLESIVSTILASLFARDWYYFGAFPSLALADCLQLEIQGNCEDRKALFEFKPLVLILTRCVFAHYEVAPSS